jgi:APA family basic amino acid/polyamine antiporter
MTKEALFVRTTSGLMRSVSTFDAFLMGTFMVNIGMGGALVYGWGASVFPNGNLPIAMLISTLGAVFISAVYAVFTASMPRSGGDYTYVSRVLHPSIGFASNFNFALLNIFWVASDSVFMVYIIGIALHGVSIVTGNAGLLETAKALFVDPTTIVILTTVAIIAYGVIAAVGIKWSMRIQKIAFVLGMIGVVVAVVLFLFMPNAEYVSKYNAVMGQNAYSDVIETAKDTGLVLGAPQELIPTLGVASIACAAMLYGFYPTYIGSEVKNADRVKTQITAIVGSTLFAGVMITLLAYLLVGTVGQDFLAAINYIPYTAPEKFPFLTTPFYPMLLEVVSNLPVVIIIGVAFAAWAFIWPLNCVLVATRCMFAWSFDRVVPSSVAYVHPRTRAPLVAIVITIIVSEIITVLVVYNQALLATVFGSIAGTLFSMIAVMIAGLVFPYRRKDIYEKSPSTQKIVGIPLIAILSIIGLAFVGLFLYFYITYPAIGLWNPISVALFVGVWIVGFALYGISYLVRKKQGIDLTMLFKEIPPG